MTIRKFLPGIWRTAPLPDGTIFEIRAVNRGTPCVHYDVYELANEWARGERVRRLCGNPRLSSTRRELIEHIFQQERHP